MIQKYCFIYLYYVKVALSLTLWLEAVLVDSRELSHYRLNVIDVVNLIGATVVKTKQLLKCQPT